MKVLHLITNLGVGGAERMLLNLLTHPSPSFQALEHVVVYFHNGPIADQLKSHGIRTIQIQGLISPYDFVGLWRLWRTIKKEHPDLIHAALWSANLLARLCGKILEIPIICDLHSDCTYHGTLRNTLDKLTHTRSTHYVAVAKSVATAYQKEIPCLQPAQITTIYNGIQIKRYQDKDTAWLHQTRAKYSIDPDARIVGAVGRLVPIKQYDFLLRSMAELINQGQNIHFIIIGDGPERAKLETLAETLGIRPQVIFTGLQNDVHSWYQLFDIFVSCSKSEGMSMVILEALAAGRPIIVTSPTNTHEIIEQDKTGLIIPPSNQRALTEALKKLLADNELATTLSANAAQTAVEKFGIAAAQKAYENLYLKKI